MLVVVLHSQNGWDEAGRTPLRCLVPRPGSTGVTADPIPPKIRSGLEETMGWGYGKTVPRGRSLLLALYSGTVLQ